MQKLSSVFANLKCKFNAFPACDEDFLMIFQHCSEENYLHPFRDKTMQLLVRFTQPIYRRLLCKRSWEQRYIDLSVYSKESLGGELDQFLKRHHFSLMPGFESHDVFHVLLGYQPYAVDEARMQFCLWGSGRYTLYTLGTMSLSICVYPEYIRNFFSHYQKGRRFKYLKCLSWQSCLNVPLNELRAFIQRGSSQHILVPC